ncbi:hypothetical protein MKW94_015104 [Papaver nudicaule]|uniref:Bifunctional inhibitor/plant lipid transfer protein/seed storage helical domain-containing protein n=1 Tax=Papaver nudicaule TaxID=74823 RepID=A0AA41RPJ0_PAPNU|nr:hypothetical protein [Papaver nudicaule]
MARFNITTSMAVLLVAMFAVAAVEASIYRTIVTTTKIDDAAADNQQYSQRCQRQMRGMRMDRCRQYLRQPSQQWDDIESNPTGQAPQECCRELRGVSEECRCEAVRQMVQQIQGQAYQGQMMQKARQLPSMCGMRPQYCDIRGRYVEY